MNDKCSKIEFITEIIGEITYPLLSWDWLIEAKFKIIQLTGRRINEITSSRGDKIIYQINVGELKTHDWVWTEYVLNNNSFNELLLDVLTKILEDYLKENNEFN